MYLERCRKPFLMTPPSTKRTRTPVTAAAHSMLVTRGRARTLRQLVDTSSLPMLIFDNDRRCRRANRAARLLTRMSRADLLASRIDDLTPRYQLATLEQLWEKLIVDGAIAGSYEIHFKDGSRLVADYCALANMLPGRHLVVFAPAGWPEDELGLIEDGTRAPLTGPLSPREREVLSLVATGLDLQQVADELTISIATVRTHVGNAHRKLGARNRPHAVALAMRLGLIDVPSV